MTGRTLTPTIELGVWRPLGVPGRDSVVRRGRPHDDAYHVAPLGSDEGLTRFAPAGAYSDFDASVTTTRVSGPTDQPYGPAFRMVDTYDGYIFAISDYGTARVFLVKNGTISPLSPVWTFSPGISRAAGNVQHAVAVQVRGSVIICLIDGAQVGELRDSTYARGALGVYAGYSGLDVAFTDFAVTSAK